MHFRRFLSARFESGSYLGLHLTLSSALAGAAVWVSHALLDAVLDNATLVRLDLALASYVHRHVNPVGIAVSRILSIIGSPSVITVIAVIGGVVLIARARPTLLATWVAVFGGGWLIERVLKVSVHRSRPAFSPTPATEVLQSFPSGHAMMCVLGIGMLMYVLLVPQRFARPWRAVVIGLAVSFVLLVGISRVYLGAHYPSDVLGGYAFGLAWLSACIGISGIALHRTGRALVEQDRRLAPETVRHDRGPGQVF